MHDTVISLIVLKLSSFTQYWREVWLFLNNGVIILDKYKLWSWTDKDVKKFITAVKRLYSWA